MWHSLQIKPPTFYCTSKLYQISWLMAIHYITLSIKTDNFFYQLVIYIQHVQINLHVTSDINRNVGIEFLQISNIYY